MKKRRRTSRVDISAAHDIVANSATRHIIALGVSAFCFVVLYNSILSCNVIRSCDCLAFAGGYLRRAYAAYLRSNEPHTLSSRPSTLFTLSSTCLLADDAE